MATYRSELYVPVEVNNYDYLPTHQQERHLGRAETRGVPQQRLHRYPSLSNICSPTMHSDLGSSAGANPGYSTVGRPAHSGASSVADWSDLTTGTGRVASGAGSSRSKGPMEATYLPVHAGYGQLGCGDAWYDEMKRRFDERRRRWDENVKRMRDEFFRDPFDATPSALADSDRKVSCMESQPVVTNYERGADEQMHFIAKFVVSDFAPELVKVSVRQSQLVVSARLEQQAGATSSSREFTKSIDLPRHVIETQISATVTADGVLVVDCPLRSGLTGAGSPSPAAGQTTQDSDRTTGLTFKDRQSPPAFAAGLARPPVPGGLRAGLRPRAQFHLEIPIGTDYSPTEIQVRTLNQRVYINARHEEKSSNRTAFREFSKEYDIPENVDPQTVEARLMNGVLHIEAVQI